MNVDSIRTDVAYAVEQCHRALVASHACSQGVAVDATQRAMDALERVEGALAADDVCTPIDPPQTVLGPSLTQQRAEDAAPEGWHILEG